MFTLAGVRLIRIACSTGTIPDSSVGVIYTWPVAGAVPVCLPAHYQWGTTRASLFGRYKHQRIRLPCICNGEGAQIQSQKQDTAAATSKTLSQMTVVAGTCTNPALLFRDRKEVE